MKLFVQEEFCAGRFKKVTVVNENQDPGTWEFSSINLLLRHAKYLADRNIDAHLLYIHTKGLRKDGDFIAKWHWRKYLEYRTLERQQDARQLLTLGYDTVGSNVINPPGALTPERAYTRIHPDHNWHYSGNFWWSTASHFAKNDYLPIKPGHMIDIVERNLAENIILSRVPNMCAGILHQAEQSHMVSIKDITQFNFWNVTTGTRLLKTTEDLAFELPFDED